MATDRDEQKRQQEEQEELEEIRRSFAEMGARMGSLFEPAEPEQAEQPVLLPPPAAPARPRWWRPAALALLFVAGIGFGYVLPNRAAGEPDSPPPPSATVTTRAQAATPPPTAPPRTKVSVPEECLETAEWGDEVISRLNRKIRDDRLVLALREYTTASQACRKEASRDG
jgi:hypothetical protein